MSSHCVLGVLDLALSGGGNAQENDNFSASYNFV